MPEAAEPLEDFLTLPLPPSPFPLSSYEARSTLRRDSPPADRRRRRVDGRRRHLGQRGGGVEVLQHSRWPGDSLVAACGREVGGCHGAEFADREAAGQRT